MTPLLSNSVCPCWIKLLNYFKNETLTDPKLLNSSVYVSWFNFFQNFSQKLSFLQCLVSVSLLPVWTIPVLVGITLSAVSSVAWMLFIAVCFYKVRWSLGFGDVCFTNRAHVPHVCQLKQSSRLSLRASEFTAVTHCTYTYTSTRLHKHL